LGVLRGDPIVVRYAPQLEILKRTSLVITHAGLNTVLESLAEGMPLVALPLGNDQPGVAARVAARGAGVVVSRRGLTAEKLRRAVRAVLEDARYRDAADRLRAEIRQVDGLEVAANVIEKALGLTSSGVSQLRVTA
jgi:zeaxanthin glucosyltransferase